MSVKSGRYLGSTDVASGAGGAGDREMGVLAVTGLGREGVKQ